MVNPPDPPPKDSSVRRAFSMLMAVLRTVLGGFRSKSKKIPAKEKSPESTPFEFLQLPWVAQREVINSLCAMDFINFALASTHLYKVAASVKRQLQSVTWVFGEGDDYPAIKLHDSNERNGGFTIYIPPYDDLDWARGSVCNGLEYHKVFKEFSLNGIKVFISDPRKEEVSNRDYILVDYLDPSKETQEMVMMEFCKIILGIFRIEDHKLEYKSVEKVTNCFLFGFIKQFSNIKIDQDQEKEAQFTVEELEFLNESVNCESLYLSTNLPNDHSFEQPLRFKEIDMLDAHWLSMNSILNSSSTKISILFPSLTDFQINVMLRTWKSGGLQNLRDFSIELEEGHSIQVIFEGFLHVADKKDRSDFYYIEETDRKEVPYGINSDYEITTHEGELKAKVAMRSELFFFYPTHPE